MGRLVLTMHVSADEFTSNPDGSHGRGSGGRTRCGLV